MTTHFPNFDLRTSAFSLPERMPPIASSEISKVDAVGQGVIGKIGLPRPANFAKLDQKKTRLIFHSDCRFKAAKDRYDMEVEFLMERQKSQINIENYSFAVDQERYAREVKSIGDQEKSLISLENSSLTLDWERKIKIEAIMNGTLRQKALAKDRFRIYEERYNLKIGAISEETASRMARANQVLRNAEIEHDNEVGELTEQYRLAELKEFELITEPIASEGKFLSIAMRETTVAEGLALAELPSKVNTPEILKESQNR
jgi:hypothetical protein